MRAFFENLNFESGDIIFSCAICIIAKYKECPMQLSISLAVAQALTLAE